MVTEVQSSNPNQSHGSSLLSMFPRTFKDPTNDALKSNNSDDPDYIHHYLKSMALKSPDKLFEQAKSILEGGSEFLKTNVISVAAPQSKPEAIAAKGNQNPQKRRPGLGRKQAQFSSKPETSQPTASLEPSFNIDQQQNPEDFFDAYEKFENARKELKRQKGDDMSVLEEVKSSVNARGRRPGISGKKVMYRHRQYSVCSEDDILSSQEASQNDIPKPSNDDSRHETTFTFADSQEKELAGSISKAENRVNELFDELLSSQIESFDGEKAVSFLQDRLQIKPVDLENLCLPDFHDVSRTDVVSSEEKAPRERYSLSDIRNLLDGVRSVTPVKDKQLSGSPIQPLASPTPPKNPFASLSLLGKRISQSMTSIDPFSSNNIDLPATSPSAEILNGKSDQNNTRLELSISDKSASLSKDKVTTNTVANDPHELPRGDVTSKLVDDNTSKLGASVDVMGRGSCGGLKDDDQCNGMDDRVMNDNLCGPNVETNAETCQRNAVEVNAEDVLREALPSVQRDVNMEEPTDMDVRPHGLHDIDGNAKDMQQQAAAAELHGLNVELLEMEHLDDNQSLLGQKNPTATEDHDEGRPYQAPESGPDQQNEEHQIVSRKERTRKTHQGTQRKALSRRQSLAAAGTNWKSGVRRSSRVKHRPLEYWKGERLLYGRVHNSLPTVIGLKYISPTKGEEEGTFKVKSYVSDEYKELVELAALH